VVQLQDKVHIAQQLQLAVWWLLLMLRQWLRMQLMYLPAPAACIQRQQQQQQHLRQQHQEALLWPQKQRHVWRQQVVAGMV
jgi:hypothetical protein